MSKKYTVNQVFMSLSTYYLEDGRHLAWLHRRRCRRCRRRSYAPTSNTASHDNHEKINSWVSFSFLYGYGAPLDCLSGRRSSANDCWNGQLLRVSVTCDLYSSDELCRCHRMLDLFPLVLPSQGHCLRDRPNSIIVLLYIFHIIHPQKQKRSVQPFCFWGEHSKGLSNQADVERNICSRYCIYHVKFTSYCELIECSRPIRFFIESLMYNNSCWLKNLSAGV